MKAITAHKGENTLKMVKPRRSYLLNCVGGTEIMLLFILLAIEKLTYWEKKSVWYSSLHALSYDMLLNMVSWKNNFKVSFDLGRQQWRSRSPSEGTRVLQDLAYCCEVSRTSIKKTVGNITFYWFPHLVWQWPIFHQNEISSSCYWFLPSHKI